MNSAPFENNPADHNYGLDVDAAIKRRERGRYDFQQGKMQLLEMGAKTIDNEGRLTAHPNLDLKAYSAHKYQEFSWVAENRDGTVIKQFEDDGTEHHFGHIDQSFAVLSKISFISNFADDTDNAEKRVILTLDWQTGQFTLLNGFMPVDVRNATVKVFPAAGYSPKLILKMVKRQSPAVGIADGEVIGTTFYNRYILGWEIPQGDKLILCIEPNGFVHLWHEK